MRTYASITLSLFASLIFAQTENCDCFKRETIKVCYASDDIYCFDPNFTSLNGCEYTMDGSLMENGI